MTLFSNLKKPSRAYIPIPSYNPGSFHTAVPTIHLEGRPLLADENEHIHSVDEADRLRNMLKPRAPEPVLFSEDPEEDFELEMQVIGAIRRNEIKLTRIDRVLFIYYVVVAGMILEFLIMPFALIFALAGNGK